MFCEAAEWVWLKEENEFSSNFLFCVCFSLSCVHRCAIECARILVVSLFSSVSVLKSSDSPLWTVSERGGRRQRKKMLLWNFRVSSLVWTERERVWMIFWTFCWPCQLFNYLRISEIIENSLTFFSCCCSLFFYRVLHSTCTVKSVTWIREMIFMAELSLGWRATTNRIEYRKWWVHVWALHTSQTSFPFISTRERFRHFFFCTIRPTTLHRLASATTNLPQNNLDDVTSRRKSQRYSNLSIYTTFTQNEKDQN